VDEAYFFTVENGAPSLSSYLERDGNITRSSSSSECFTGTQTAVGDRG
jgi:hypothetical protein